MTRAVLALVLIGFAMHGCIQLVPHQSALACARASDGADQSIVNCYTSRGLVPPKDLT